MSDHGGFWPSFSSKKALRNQEWSIVFLHSVNYNKFYFKKGFGDAN